MSVEVTSVDAAGRSEHRSTVGSLRAGLFASHQSDVPTTMHVTARFLPYDDVRRVTLTNSVENKNKRKDEKDRLAADRSVPCHMTRSRSQTALSQCAASPPSPSLFFMKLQEALDVASSDGDFDADSSADEARDRWAQLFRQWPLELAASGYAEWWLRHRWCPDGAPALLQALIDELAKVERCRRFHRSDGRDTIATTPGAAKDIAQSRDLRGAMRMLLAVFADLPHSLRAALLTPPYHHHHQLFFYTCRLGAHRQQGVNEEEDAAELGLFLSLAAAIAQKIEGSHLEMKGDLMRFLGRVGQNWHNLLKTRSEEQLNADHERVQKLLENSSDRIT